MSVALNRRSFVKAGACVGVAGIASSVAGTALATDSAAQDALAPTVDEGLVLAEPLEEERAFKSIEVVRDGEEATYDVVVVGGGTSGICAALSAAQSGAKTVIVEKTATTGGMGNLSKMIAGAQSKLQKEAGRDIAVNDLYGVMRDHFLYTNNLALVRRILDASGENIDWLAENGLALMVEPEELNLQPGLERFQEKCAHMMQGSSREAARPNDATEGNLKGLYNTYFEDYAGELMLETRAVKLLAGEDGHSVEGVVCQRADGSQITLKAGAVILAAGSWDGNTAYLRNILASVENFVLNSGGKTSTSGDGVYLAEQVGGHRWINTPVWHQVYYANLDGTANWDWTNAEDQASLRYNADLVWVNAEGVRYVDESVSGAFAQRGSAAFSQGGFMWLVFDHAALEDIEANGTSAAVPPINTIEPGSGVLARVEDTVAAGQVLAADTLDGLAEVAGFDADAFAETVATYNEAVESGEDKLFLKDPSHLVYPISTAPFYAVRLTCNNEGGSLAGVRVNQDLKVCRKDDGKPFANLFAVGQNSSGFFGYGSYVDIQGMTMGYATGSGRLAGATAAKVALGE